MHIPIVDSNPFRGIPQAVVTGTMRCYGAMLQVTRRVSEPPEADSWRPLQEGFFAAFSAFCASATELSLSWGEGSTAANEEPRSAPSHSSVFIL